MKVEQETIRPPRGFEAAPPGSPYDFRRRDGRIVLEVKRGAGGVRDLRDGIVQLAQAVKADPKIEWACLVLTRGRMSGQKAMEEWTDVVDGILQPNLRKRLALIWIEPNTFDTKPDDRDLQSLGAELKESLEGAETAWKERRTSMSPSLFEVVKVLLHAWLRREGPLQVGEIQRAAGVAYPTVANALQFLEDRREVARLSDRSAELTAFPTASWSEILALSDSLRQPMWYADRSGRPLDPEFIIERLMKRRCEGIALGGVVGARHWHPGFDLNGTPRIDVSLHRQTAPSLLEVLDRIDPSLQSTPRADERTVLVFHPFARGETFFEHAAGQRLPFADPVEVLLDLCEMRLASQAEEMVHFLRQGNGAARP